MKKVFNFLTEKQELIYLIGFSLIVISRMIYISTLIDIGIVYHIILGVAIGFLAIKVIVSKFTWKQRGIIAIFFAIILYVYFVTHASFFITTFLCIVAIKDVDIKKVVKIDITIKLITLIINYVAFGITYIINFDSVATQVKIASKGISHFLYFVNPNTAAMITLWVIFDYIYLKEKATWKTYLVTTLVMLVTFYVTLSRTAICVYVIFLVLQFINLPKLLDFIYRYIYLVITTFTFLIMQFVNIESPIYKIVNKLLSNRLLFSINAYAQTGLNVLPRTLETRFFDTYIIDNYYVRCFINYGLLTLLLFYIPIVMVPRKGFEKEKKFSILSTIYLFFENVTINVGIALPYVFLADIIFNKKGLKDGEKEKIKD